jgi:hypothetical protein
VALPAITGKTDKGLPQYQDAVDDDIFVMSASGDLVPALVQSAGRWIRESRPNRLFNGNQYSIHRYRPRVEGLFAWIEHWVNLSDAQDTFWRTISKANITSLV